MDSISDYLEQNGPTRSSIIADWLQKDCQITAEAARKRISRIKQPLRKFPIHLLPKGESFLYHQEQRKEERFWVNLQRDMRATESIFGAAIDGLIARHGVILEKEFLVISGATSTPLKKQLMAKTVADRLINAGIIERRNLEDGNSYLFICRNEISNPDWGGIESRNLTEGIILDGLREWAKKLGLASYNKINIRGEINMKPVGPFMFDLAGPSYLLPFKNKVKQPGFLVADVFSDGILDEYQIRYFIRKAQIIQSVMKNTGVLGMLIAEGFTGKAITEGHTAGIILSTPKDIFGNRAGKAIQTLLETLSDTARYASSSPERIAKLINDLSEIEGSAGNLRGILFELLVAYLARRSAVSIDMGVRAKDASNGKTADIDILKFTSQGSECTAIECKAKIPGGSVNIEEVQDWIRRLPTFQAHIRSLSHLKEAKITFEIWTSGNFNTDALELLNKEKEKRLKCPISWKDGQQVLSIAKEGKEKAITDALQQHFIKHPLYEVIQTNRQA
jgi:hypothetical protein